MERFGVSVKRAAEMLDCSIRQIYVLRDKGTIRFFYIGKLARIPIEDLRAIAATASSKTVAAE